MIYELQTYLQKEPIKFPAGFDLVAILLYSLTGVLVAIRRNYDLVGVFTLALVVGAGGGLIRDGLFLQQGPPAMMRDWRFPVAVLAACVIGWIVNSWIVRFRRVIAVLDAVGLSILSMIGLVKSIEVGLSVPASILVGVVNAAGGGLLRDILTHEEPLLFKPGQFYVLASLLGCLVFVFIAYHALAAPRHAALIAMTTIFLLRIFAIIFNWRTTPLQPLFTASSPSQAMISNNPPPTDLGKPS